MRKTFIFTAFLSLTLISTPGLSRAEEACDLSAEAKELVSIQADTSLDEIQYLNAEIAARRNLLSAAIACDERDIAARVEALGSLPDKIKSREAYRKILEGLAETARFYSDQKGPIASLGLRDLRSSSRAIAERRKTEYIPLLTLTDNFIFWANNQQFLERASERLGQVSRVAFSLKLVNQDEVNMMFERARSNFDTAFAESDKAIRELDRGRAGVALAHTKASLQALSETYQVFFDLQETLKRIVGQ